MAWNWALNNYGFKVDRCICEMENIAVDLAANRMDKELVFAIISSLLHEDDYREELKLKIIHAKRSPAGILSTDDWELSKQALVICQQGGA